MKWCWPFTHDWWHWERYECAPWRTVDPDGDIMECVPIRKRRLCRHCNRYQDKAVDEQWEFITLWGREI